MKKPDFVYVTYIATTPEKVWQAFVDTDVMAQYWMGATCARVNVSDWKPGSKWEHQHADDARAVDIVSKVVESNPPRAWSTPGPGRPTPRTRPSIRAWPSTSNRKATGWFA